MTQSRYDVRIVQMAAEARFELVAHEAEARAALEAAGLVAPPVAKAMARNGDVSVAWIGPRRWLISAPLSAGESVERALSGKLPQASSTLLANVTGSTVTFGVHGADMMSVLQQGIAHDLSIAGFPAGSILATEGWGIGLLLERDGEHVRVTVDMALAAYLSNCLRSAAGQATDTLPGVMRAPPPPIGVSK